MPAEGVELSPDESMLTLPELERLARVFVERGGVEKIRFTGGEPLVRRGVEELCATVAALDGLKQLAITTNAINLERKLKPLVAAGVTHMNISLDTLVPAKFQLVTRRNGCERVPRMITQFTLTEGTPAATRRLDDGPHETSKTYSPGPSFRGRIGFITSMSEHFCGGCNRMRITADGHLKVCLFGSDETNLRDPMRRCAVRPDRPPGRVTHPSRACAPRSRSRTPCSHTAALVASLRASRVPPGAPSRCLQRRDRRRAP